MRITTKGLKANDQDLELGKLTLVVGPNGSGKSTIARAVQFVALGYVPELGKRPIDTAALMRGSRMSVELDLADGRAVHRTLECLGDRYQTGAEASWLRNAKPTEASKEILGIFGREELDVAECLDVRQLLSATANQRAARIDQLLAAGKKSPADTARAVARFVVWRLIPNLPEDRMPENHLEALPMVAERQVAVLREVAPMLEGKIAELGIAGLITWANEEKRSAAQGLKQKEGAAGELRIRAAEIPEPDEREIQRLQDEQARLREALGALRQANSTYQTKKAQREQLQAALTQVREISSRTNRVAQDAEAVHGRAIAELREQLTNFKKAAELLQAPEPKDDREALAIEREAEDLLQKSYAVELPTVPKETEEQTKVDTIQLRLDATKGSKWREVLEAVDEIRQKLSKTSVKDIAKQLKTLEELARWSMGATPTELRHDLDAAKAALAQAKARIPAAERALEEARAKRDSLTFTAREKRGRAAKLREDLQRAAIEAKNAYEATRRKLAGEISDVEQKIAGNERSLDAARDEKASVDRRLASLEDQLRGAGDPGPAPASPETAAAKLQEIDGRLAELLRARATHQEIQHVLSSIEDAKAARDVFSAIEWALQRQREVEITESGGPLLALMRQVLKAAGRAEDPFFRAGGGSCAIGWRTEDGRDIQVQALSGGEWALFAAALAGAVIAIRQAEVKVLLVEAGETDEETLIQILEGVRAIEQHLTAAIVMSPRPARQAVEGWWTVSAGQENEIQAKRASA